MPGSISCHQTDRQDSDSLFDQLGEGRNHCFLSAVIEPVDAGMQTAEGKRETEHIENGSGFWRMENGTGNDMPEPDHQNAGKQGRQNRYGGGRKEHPVCPAIFSTGIIFSGEFGNDGLVGGCCQCIYHGHNWHGKLIDSDVRVRKRPGQKNTKVETDESRDDSGCGQYDGAGQKWMFAHKMFF